MNIKIVELKKVNKYNIVIFPYAGGFYQSYIPIIPSIPADYGLLVAEYPSIEEASNVNFTYLTKTYASLLMNLNFANIILIGISFGGYIVYRIVQIIYAIAKILPKAINLLSVMDIPSLLTQINNPNFDILSIIESHETTNNFDVLQELSKFVIKDIKILRSVQINENIKIPTDLTIINGLQDQICNNDKTYLYWRQLVSGKLYIKPYIGTHLPNNEIITSIITGIDFL